ncbi:hypothetical protein ACQ4PT_012414 [Festuca glaucescens]
MELRSGRRLRSASTAGTRRLRRPLGCSDGRGSDWINALPDEMLLQIIVRLRCARAATLTSTLSCRWRGLWRHLPELSSARYRRTRSSPPLTRSPAPLCPSSK